MRVEAEFAVGLLIAVPTPIAMVDVAYMVMTMRGMWHVMTVLLATRVAVTVRVAMAMSHVLHASVVMAGSVVVRGVAVRNLHARQQQMSGDCRKDR